MSPAGPERPIDGMSPETVVQWSSCRFVSGGKANIVGDIRPLIGGGISGSERLDGALAAWRQAPLGATAAARRGEDGGWRRS